MWNHRLGAGPMPLYWLICRGESHGEAVLMRASDNGDKGVIVARQQYQIDPLDTYKLLENKVAQMAAQCVMSFVDASVNENTSLLADKVPGETALTHLPNEQDLVVNFGQMTSIQIADMARAGNPVFSGCTIYLGQTPLSLMQATAIKYPTYGVEPGTICHTGEPDGVVVATKDGALRLDVIANMDGVFSGCAFVERFQVSAGMSFS